MPFFIKPLKVKNLKTFQVSEVKYKKGCDLYLRKDYLFGNSEMTTKVLKIDPIKGEDYI